MMEFTPKEVSTIGYNRYMSEKQRYWWACGALMIGMVLALVFMTLTENHILNAIRIIVGLVLAFSGFGYAVWVLSQATKAGKEFLAQWLKEKGNK